MRSQVQRFRPALARPDVAMKLLSHFMDLASHHNILTCQVWARGSKVHGLGGSGFKGSAPPLATEAASLIEKETVEHRTSDEFILPV